MFFVLGVKVQDREKLIASKETVELDLRVFTAPPSRALTAFRGIIAIDVPFLEDIDSLCVGH
jgi:hypothetical protein